MSPARLTVAGAALLLALATMLGAYGSHALPGRIDAAALAAWQTAVDYQFIHGLGLLALGLTLDRHAARRGLMLGVTLLGAGVLLFSGGICVPILGGPGPAGPVVPIGGTLLIAGWLVCATSFLLPPREIR